VAQENAKLASMCIAWGTKAETLERLQPLLNQARVLPQIRFTSQQWQHQAAELIGQLEQQDWLNKPLIVRSSAAQEDGLEQSLAGHFVSVLDVLGLPAIDQAVKEVMDSFAEDSAGQQIFIQPMLQDIALSGVAFSHDPNTGSPYWVINYDDQSGATDTVTSGRSNRLQTVYHYREAACLPPAPLSQVIALLLELEALLPAGALDIEFALDTSGQVWLFQVRPLQVPSCSVEQVRELTSALQGIERHFSNLNRPHPYLHGQHTLFGVMPDWNPAEIIGIRPGVLARTLYQELITDSIWAYQRHNYGYRNLRSFPLLQSFGGCPYIDVRLSFNSFIPAELPPELAERLAQYYLDRLQSFPNYHDKVEFEILFSCYTLDLPERLQILHAQGFSKPDIDLLADSLRRLTHEIIHPETGLWKQDIQRIHRLEARQQELNQAKLDPFAKIYWLLEDCKRYGTLPFAGLARAGFIAVQMLRSLVETQILTEPEYAQFLAQLNTISSGMSHEFTQLSRQAFLEKYGHLRPGTYDLNSPRYDEAPERYFDWTCEQPAATEPAPFVLTLKQFREIEESLQKHQLDLSVLGLFDFIKQAIEGREYAKFVFTRSLSQVLQEIANVSVDYGLDADQAAQLDIKCFYQLYTSSAEPETLLRQSMRNGLQQAELTRRLILPPLISQKSQIWSLKLEQGEPNYITLQSAIGRVTHIHDAHADLADSILLIESADP